MTTTTFGHLCFRSLRVLGTLVALTLTLASPAASGATIGSLLYGHRYADGTWYTINPATAAATEIAGFLTLPTGGVGFRDLGGAAAVPEPSTLALAAIGVAGGLAHQVRRRRMGASNARRSSAPLPVSEG